MFLNKNKMGIGVQQLLNKAEEVAASMNHRDVDASHVLLVMMEGMPSSPILRILSLNGFQYRRSEEIVRTGFLADRDPDLPMGYSSGYRAMMHWAPIQAWQLRQTEIVTMRDLTGTALMSGSPVVSSLKEAAQIESQTRLCTELHRSEAV